MLTKGGFGKVEPRADGQGWWVVCTGITGTYEVSAKRGPRRGLESRLAPAPVLSWPCKHALALLPYLAENPEARPEATNACGDCRQWTSESLLRIAFASPADDTARLVLADYLEENDQPDRAALIRLQCEMARLPEDDSNYRDLREREKALTATVWKQLGRRPSGCPGDFHRGFTYTSSGPGHSKTPEDGRSSGPVRTDLPRWVGGGVPPATVPTADAPAVQTRRHARSGRPLHAPDGGGRATVGQKEVGPNHVSRTSRPRRIVVELSDPHRTMYEMLSATPG